MIGLNNDEYIVRSTEQTKAKGAEFETKALLYLMNFRDDSNEMFYFVVDFFNDLTALNRLSNKSWDLQSKGKKNNYQSDIGQELVTLYKNFVSCLNFNYYILFLGGVVDSIRIDQSLNIFDQSNITSKSLVMIKTALEKECIKKSYVADELITSAKIDDFLSRVVFVIDNISKAEYVKSIAKVNPLIVPDDLVLEKIFNQIRDEQSSKKNNNCVEGVAIAGLDEFIYYNRYLTTHEIKLMVLNRIINNNIMQKGITESFLPIYNRIPSVSRKELMEDCQLEIARILFDKNNAENFWKLFNAIYSILTENHGLSINDAYKLIEVSLLENVTHLSMISAKYFMAIIKDGIYEN